MKKEQQRQISPIYSLEDLLQNVYIAKILKTVKSVKVNAKEFTLNL